MKAINLDIHNLNTQRSLKNFMMRYIFALDYIKVNNIVLDLPSGTGWGMKILSVVTENDRIYGLELDDDCYSYSRKKFPELKNIRQGDMRKRLHFKDNSFDVVTCFEGIEHIPKPDGRNMFFELKRILKPDGMCIGSTPDQRLVENLIKPKEEHCCLYSRDGLIDLLKILTGGVPHLSIRTHILTNTFLWVAWNKKSEKTPPEKERTDLYFSRFRKGRQEKNTVMEIAENEWKDNQIYELGFWKENIRGYKDINKFKHPKFCIRDLKENNLEEYCKNKIIVDVGSGPLGGLLNTLDYKIGLSVEPLAKKLEDIGWINEDKKYILICAEAENIPLMDNFADCVSTRNSIDHMANAPKAISEMVRILKLGGRLYINVDLRKISQAVRGHRICLDDKFFKVQAERNKLKIIHEHTEQNPAKGQLLTYIGIFEK